jgi:hypothetical protein
MPSEMRIAIIALRLSSSPNARTDDLLTRDAHVARAELALERRLDLRRRVLHLRARRAHVAGGADGELTRAAELLNLRAREARRVDGRPDVGDVRRLGELELHQRAAGELDAPVEPPVQHERDQPRPR